MTSSHGRSGPPTIDFVATSPLPSSPTTSVPAGPAHPHPKAGASKPVTASKAGGLPVGTIVGAGVGGSGRPQSPAAQGWCPSFADAASTGPIRRSGSRSPVPLSLPGPPLPGGAVLRPDGQAILVKILGALQLEGAKRKAISVPVLEIIVFLVLNPGETFNSAQLRERIWGLGRKPITSGTFRNYMDRTAEGPRARHGGHRALQLHDDGSCHLRPGPVPCRPRGWRRGWPGRRRPSL